MGETERSETTTVSWVVTLVADRTGESICSGHGDTQQQARDDCARSLWVGRQSVQQYELIFRMRGMESGPELTAMRERIYPKSRTHVITARYVDQNIHTSTITIGRLAE